MQKIPIYLKYVIAVGFLLLNLTFSAYLTITSPVFSNITENSSIVFLGKAAPGQTIYIEALSETVFNNTYSPIGWDIMNATVLPNGWTSIPTKLYERPKMRLQIKISTDAQYGVNSVKVTAKNVYNGESLTFIALVNITKEIFDADVQKKAEAGPLQPLQYLVRIHNKGISDDPFQISCTLPIGCKPVPIIVIHNTTREAIYEVLLPDPKEYSFGIKINLLNNPNVTKTFNVTGTVKKDIKYDFKAVGNGALLSPILEWPIYSLLGVISNFIK